jgi:hypothetical protein
LDPRRDGRIAAHAVGRFAGEASTPLAVVAVLSVAGQAVRTPASGMSHPACAAIQSDKRRYRAVSLVTRPRTSVLCRVTVAKRYQLTRLVNALERKQIPRIVEIRRKSQKPEGAVGLRWRSPKTGALPGCATPRPNPQWRTPGRAAMPHRFFSRTCAPHATNDTARVAPAASALRRPRSNARSARPRRGVR